MERKVRVRFAPSPTGPLHIGGVRTALYNYLFAKQNGGDFILRIEDTDQTRFVEGAEDYIVESFQWLGLKFDEGVGIGGEYGPYKQSDRKELYRKYALELVEKGWAYYAFDTPEELDVLRKQYECEKKNFQYDCNTRKGLRNSLTLSKEEVEDLLNQGVAYVIRFKFPENEDIHLDDLIRGHVKMNSSLLDDKVLYKSDGMPTYHLANIVDDHLMKISHVIRGEEWLPSCPLHVMLYKAFGWEDTMPQFAHLPLLLKPDGNGKLSKRDGDRLGFPVFPLQWTDPKSKEISSGYRESGYLPEAVINMLALLGWNSGTEQEIFSLEELVKIFSIDRISKHGAKFDLEKAKWFNHQYLQKVEDDKLAQEFIKDLKSRNIDSPLDKVKNIVRLVKERCNFVKDFWDNSDYFFVAPNSYAEKALKKRWKEGTSERMCIIAERMKEIGDNSSWADNTEEFLMKYIAENELNMGQIMNSIRLAVVGDTKGVNMVDIMRILGKQEIISRITTAAERINL
ncbi:MAG: glutamate--tRNA ligase [Bacteroidales bacterium]|jgi:glutamyl-tRNA synthetase|nr:glutamate--tRNA ligase [Bacteroidales bacterium]MEE1142522.1 glutamate--tRNA ligase [Bacteroidales bacterium]